VDIVRQSATEKPSYNGVFLPSFFNAEAVAAVGVSLKLIKQSPQFFQTEGAHGNVLQMLRDEQMQKPHPPFFTFALMKEGRVFGARCNLRLRVPEMWPPHPFVKDLLVAGRISKTDAKAAQTFKDQIVLLQKLKGWRRDNLSGTVNEAFAEHLSNALELIYFGVDAAKVRITIVFINAPICAYYFCSVSHWLRVRCTHAADSSQRQRLLRCVQIAALTPQEINIASVYIQFKRIVGDHMQNYKNKFSGSQDRLTFQNAIPSFWQGEFPCIFLLPVHILSDDRLFEGGTVLGREAVDNVRALLKRSRDESSDEEDVARNTQARASTSGAVASTGGSAGGSAGRIF
jgi:hypothetical protein